LSADALVNGLTVGRGAGAVSSNTAVGASALASNTTGANNTSIGYQSGFVNTAGDVAFLGYRAGYANTTGDQNTAIGMSAGRDTTTGGANTSLGRTAFALNTIGSNNTAIGVSALQSNTTASNNTAVGYQAGYSAAGACPDNTFAGYQAGYNVIASGGIGGYNTFIGVTAGYSVTTGEENQFFGRVAGYQITTGSRNTIIGKFNGNQDGLDIRTANNYVVLADGGGNRQLSMYEGGTLALDNAVPNAGTGITFPATQSASSNANTLDDYEEGTFTPTIVGTTSAGTGTYSGQTGRYTKIGNRVYVNIYLSWSAHTGTGNMRLDGLPFTSINVSATYSAFSCYWSSLTLTAGYVFQAYIGPNRAFISLEQVQASAGATSVPIDTASEIMITGFYEV
jgi:hypothetical protein